MNYRDYYQFCNENAQYMQFFGHGDPKLKPEPQLLVEGRMLSWTQAKSLIFGNDYSGTLKLPIGWKYNANGVVKKDLIQWDQLETEWQDTSEDRMNGQHYIEVASISKDWRHCWIRLIDDKGGVISVGFVGKIYHWLPFRAAKGKLMSPDPYEFKDAPKMTTRIAVSAERYNKIKERIESDQKNKNLYFNQITRNCSTYVCELLNEIGIKIDNREFPTQAIGRTILRVCNIKMPECILAAFNAVAMVFRALLSPIYLLGMLILGASYTNKDIKEIERDFENKWPVKPRKLFQSSQSLFDCSNFWFSATWRLREWQRTIAAYRISRDKYGFPPAVKRTGLGFKI